MINLAIFDLVVQNNMMKYNMIEPKVIFDDDNK